MQENSDSAGTAVIPQRRATDVPPTGSIQALAMPKSLGKARAAAGLAARDPRVRKWLPAAAALIAVAAVLALALNMAAPERATLFAGLPDADKAAVVELLEGQGYEVRLDPLTGAVSVPAEHVHRARMALAAEGLPEAGATGYELLNDIPFGTSRAVEHARLQQTQETGLAASIEAVSGVESARVHIAAPEPSAFVRRRAAPTASVFLRLKGGSALGEEQVLAIVHLVSSSVAGLPPENVTVVDQRGTLLSDRMRGPMSESSQQLTFRRRLEDQWRQRISSILVPIYGLDGFTAEVALDLDFEAEQATREDFGDAGVLRSEQRSLSEQADPKAARGIPARSATFRP